jgi:hypothetical protein
MQNKRKENSVKSLINLYTVVMGLSLSLAISRLINPEKGIQSVTVYSGLLFIAFLATLIPFYHGALRHLDDAYIENDNLHIKNGALLIDFVLLLFHGIGFVILAALIALPNHFAWALIGLFSVDVVWGVFTHFGPSSQHKFSAESKWAIINCFFVLLAVAYLKSANIYLEPIEDPSKIALLLAVTCVGRSLVDYLWAQDFYFPKDSNAETKIA